MGAPIIEQIEIRIGPPRLTKYEKSRIISTRALQITMGAPILIDIHKLTDSIVIATAELEAGILPLVIRRTLPNGQFQDIPLRMLLQRD
ncbi:MAG: DNA-directed RNA polymerase subunit K [Candidatus Jordarchaeum sp.]|uniref:DNA-directed RNA polymerase subunit K n=1 Tax=Candidatus Jordarchaeum sp. TaxID=2823881 RepID=UPI004049CE6A